MDSKVENQEEDTVIKLTTSQLWEFARKVIEEYKASEEKSLKPKFLFNNKTLQEYLGVNHRLLAKYRNDGILGYSQIGEKFFYTLEDVERFLQSNYYKAYKYRE